MTSPLVTVPFYIILITTTMAKKPVLLSYQDSFGHYSFGYSDPMSARSEYRNSDGVTRGSYSYIDDNGFVQTTEYEAGDKLGFRVKATNLPQAPLPVKDTPEVNAAREEHLKLLAEAEKIGTSQNEDDFYDFPVVEAKTQNIKQEQVKTENDWSVPLFSTRVGGHVSSNNVINNPQPMTGKQNYELHRDKQMHSLLFHTAPIYVAESQPVHHEGQSLVKNQIKISDQMLNNQHQFKSALLPPGRNLQNAASSTFVEKEIPQKSKLNDSLQVSLLQTPDTVQYTPEVMAARQAHFRAYEKAARLATASDAQPQLLWHYLRGQAAGINNQLSKELVSSQISQIHGQHLLSPSLNKNNLDLVVGPSTRTTYPQLHQQADRGHVSSTPVFNGNNWENVEGVRIQVFNEDKVKYNDKVTKENESNSQDQSKSPNEFLKDAGLIDDELIEESESAENYRPIHLTSQEQTFQSHSAHHPVNRRINQISQVPLVIPAIRSPYISMEDYRLNKNQMMGNSIEKLRLNGTLKQNENPQFDVVRSSGRTPAGTSVSFARLGLKSPNEFEQTVIKTGGYFVPIEFTYLPRINTYPINYLTNLENVAF